MQMPDSQSKKHTPKVCLKGWILKRCLSDRPYQFGHRLEALPECVQALSGLLPLAPALQFASSCGQQCQWPWILEAGAMFPGIFQICPTSMHESAKSFHFLKFKFTDLENNLFQRHSHNFCNLISFHLVVKAILCKQAIRKSIPNTTCTSLALPCRRLKANTNRGKNENQRQHLRDPSFNQC